MPFRIFTILYLLHSSTKGTVRISNLDLVKEVSATNNKLKMSCKSNNKKLPFFSMLISVSDRQAANCERSLLAFLLACKGLELGARVPVAGVHVLVHFLLQ
ncbi:predicted protein [Histoplasma capsulatum var. duboisii H88]|uniref:Predicted protein n=2 Tax=Ajellomyces capsulatus TaxID=5037 RepID=F0U8V8_AJEC8|nr:predicted protein [Histoplasma capsulatum H143]EGC40960.1 predicted protein [Histoplasma capsulatum var. duboisii H88]